MSRRIKVRVIPGARRTRIDAEPDGRLRVHLSAPPLDGRANRALVEILASHFGVKKNRVSIIAGERNREKLIQIDDSTGG
ncbi:MAG TPA: DUF167 domain-containing protein [bacterium]|nr:DUF167 domain-containing protein [bacterium]HNS49438.1 DUF167 domain-containing protein [bacterium]